MLNFLGKKLLFIIAHPDDESFTSAGTMLKNQKLGGENYIISATYGEKGKSRMPEVTKRQLRQIRKAELTKVAKFLKVKSLSFFTFPDAELTDYKRNFKIKAGKIVKKLQPDYIISFGPDGMSGHLDHITAGKVAQEISKKFKIPFIAFAASPAVVKQFDQIKQRRKHGKYAAKIDHQKPNIKIAINLKHKLKILAMHKSQFDPKKPATSFAWLRNDHYEYFKA